MKDSKPVTRTFMPIEEMTDAQQALLVNKRKNEFDLRTRIIDPKTGKVLRHQPYSYVISKDGEEYFLRDGKRWSRAGVEMVQGQPSAQQLKK